MESKQHMEQNPLVAEMKQEFVVRGVKGRNRLTPEGKHMAKNTWDTVMSSIPAGEMSSAMAAVKAHEITDRLPKNEYTSLLKASFEARIRNMQRQEYIAEMKTSNSGWNGVIYSAAEQWKVGKNDQGVVTNYLADQMGDVMTSIHNAQEKVGILHGSDQAIRMEQEIAKKTALLITTHDERVTEKRNLSEVVRVAAADVAGMNSTQELDAVLLNVANLSNNAPEELSHPVYSVPAIEQAIKKQQRELPKWAKDAGVQVRGWGLRAAAIIGSITLALTQPSPVGSEIANHQPDSGHKITVDPREKPVVPSVVTVTSSTEPNITAGDVAKTSEGQENIQKAPEFGIKGVNGIDLSKPFTMTYHYTEQTIKNTGVESLVVPVDPRAQLGEEMNSDDLKDQGDAKKNPALATVLNTHIDGVNVVEPHSGQLRGWESPFVNKSNGLLSRKSGWMPAEPIRLTKDISGLIGMKVDISQIVDGKVQSETLEAYAVREIPSGYAEVAEGKRPPEGSMLYGYNKGDKQRKTHVSLSLIDVGFTVEEANDSVLALDTCAGNWQDDVAEYDKARLVLFKKVNKEDSQ